MARGKYLVLWKFLKFLVKFYFKTTCFDVKIEKFSLNFLKLSFG